MGETITRRARFGRTASRNAKFPDTIQRVRSFGVPIQRVAGYFSPAVAAFAPEDVLGEYLEADDLALANNDPVSSWGGRNGVEDGTQGTTSLQPIYIASAGGASLPAVRFDGVDDVLRADALAAYFAKTSSSNISPTFTAFVVVSAAAATNEFVWGAGAASGTATIAGMTLEADSRTLLRADNLDVFLNTGGGTRATDEIIILRCDGSTNAYDLWYGATQVVSGGTMTPTTALLSAAQLGIGALVRAGVAGNHAAMDLHAIGFADTALPTADINDLITYATDKWGY